MSVETLSSVSTFALTTITGMFLICGSNASPLMPGSIKSSSIRSGGSEEISIKASEPE